MIMMVMNHSLVAVMMMIIMLKATDMFNSLCNRELACMHTVAFMFIEASLFVFLSNGTKCTILCILCL